MPSPGLSWESLGMRIKYTPLVNKLTLISILSQQRPVQNPNHLSCQKINPYKVRVAFSKLICATKAFVQPSPVASVCTAETITSVHCTVQHVQKWTLDVHSLFPGFVYNCAKTLPVQNRIKTWRWGRPANIPYVSELVSYGFVFLETRIRQEFALSKHFSNTGADFLLFCVLFGIPRIHSQVSPHYM